ncbi:hypothetical protein B0H10DRAFT_2031545 [Mycena sp. CBHHK59/15]|nr:hypothetical protein B0H10DRAFT_2031545 [Mycena sp. CBHHK59/15]
MDSRGHQDPPHASVSGSGASSSSYTGSQASRVASEPTAPLLLDSQVLALHADSRAEESSTADRFPFDYKKPIPSRTPSQSLPELPQRLETPKPVVYSAEREGSAGPRTSVHRRNSQQPRSELDWIIPVESKREPRLKTIEERLRPTVETAKLERDKYALKARMTGYALNIAIGLQVVLGALTTGLSAVTSGKQTSIMTAILGGLSTIVASYLARARGSNQPELSITRCKDLEQYIRECDAFILDFGHISGGQYDQKLYALRDRFEELMGNANGERRLASV